MVRAKFILEVPASAPQTFPNNEGFEARLLALGLGAPDRSADYETRSKTYVDRADGVWEQFPEVAGDERDFVIFFARLPFHGRLIVSRFDEGYAVCRVLNEDLATLESGTERLVQALTSKAASLPGLEVLGNEVEVYERGYDRVIMRGYIISSPLKEVMRRQAGTAVTAAVSALAAIITIVLLGYRVFDAGSISVGTVERFSTAMLATFFVSMATLVQAYVALKRKKHIDWQAVSSTS